MSSLETTVKLQYPVGLVRTLKLLASEASTAKQQSKASKPMNKMDLVIGDRRALKIDVSLNWKL